MGAVKLSLPTKFTDLTADQLMYVSQLFLMGYSEIEFRVKALFYLTGMRMTKEIDSGSGNYVCIHPSRKRPFILDADLISEMAKKCDFILKPDEIHPIPWIRFARARQYRLYNATFEEYLMAENYYFAYIKTKNDEHLDNLIACLYRRPWHRWNSGKIQQRAKQFRKVDPAIKNAVFMWYIGFRSYVPKRCKTLFSANGSGSKRRPFDPREYINGMIHQLNNGDITIKDKLLKQSVWDALDELEQRAIDFEQANKK